MNVRITEYGAVGDGVTDNTAAFAAAVAGAVSGGGGRVVVPAGRFLTGTVRLESHVYLYLEAGAVLVGSDDYSRYSGTVRGCPWNDSTNESVLYSSAATINDCRGLVVADGAEDCGILGQGTIDGRRGLDFGYEPEKGRPFLTVFSDCRRVTVEGVTMTNTAFFTVYFLHCEDVTVRGLRLYTKKCINGDGIDLDGSRNVVISDCLLDTCDDAIGLKNLVPGQVCENVTVTNCVIDSDWGAVRIGPESCGHFRNITVSNCVFRRANDGFKFQLCENYDIEDVVCRGIVMEKVLRPFFLTSNSFPMSVHSDGIRPKGGRMRRILFSDMIVKSHTREEENFFHHDGCLVEAMPENVIEDVTFSRIHFVMPGGGTKEDARRVSFPELLDHTECYPEFQHNRGDYPSFALHIRHARGITVEDCTFETVLPDVRPALAAEDVTDLTVKNAKSKNGWLLRHYQTPGLAVEGVRGEVTPFHDIQVNEWKAYRVLSETVAREIAENAARLDAMRGGTPVAQGRAFSLKKSPDKRYYLVLSHVKGNYTLALDGVTVRERRFPPEYWFRTVAVEEVTELLGDGDHTVTLTLDPEGTEPDSIRIVEK